MIQLHVARFPRFLRNGLVQRPGDQHVSGQLEMRGFCVWSSHFRDPRGVMGLALQPLGS